MEHIQITNFKQSSSIWTVPKESGEINKLDISEILVLNYIVCL